MRIRYMLILLLGLMASSVTAQEYNVEGKLIDGTLKEPLPGAAVVLLNPKDSTQVTGVISDVNGLFKLQTHKAGTYLVRFSYMGFQTQFRSVTLSKKEPHYQFGTFVLAEDAKLMKETVVTGKMSQMEMKGDTFVYNAGAFRLPEGSNLEALVRKLPGAEITDEGVIKINGKEVKKIMIEGKNFFDGDTKMALKNLPSNMINNLKAYEKQSDYARITGIDDGEEETVLDLTVKKGMKEGWMADVDLGGGTQKRYLTKANIHRYTDRLKFSLMGSRNNVNDGGWGGWNRNNGITTSTMGGLNINWENGLKEEEAGYLELGGSVRYSGNRNNTQTRSNSQTFLDATSSTFANSMSDVLTHANNINANFRIEWAPDSMTNINFRPSFNYSTGDRFNHTQSVIFNSDPYDAGLFDPLNQYKEMTDTNNIRVNANERYNFGENNSNVAEAKLQINRRLNNSGRNVTLNLEGSYSKNENNDFSRALLNFYQRSDKTATYQNTTQPNKNYTYQARLSYSEPIFKNANLQFSYQVQHRFQDQNRVMLSYADLAKRLDDMGIVGYTAEDLYTGNITGLNTLTLVKDMQNSQYATYKELNHNAMAMLRYNSKFVNGQNVSLNIGISYQPQITHMDYVKAKIDTTIIRRTSNWAPSLNLRWKISNTSQLRINYKGKMSQPSMTNLIEVIDSSDPLNISVGNAGLKSSWNDRIHLFYNNYISEKQMGWGSFLMFSNTRRSIANATIYDARQGAQYHRPLNIDGNWSSFGNLFFNTALGTKKLFNLALRTGIAYNNRVGYMGGNLDEANRIYLSNGDNGSVNMDALFRHQQIQKMITKEASYGQNLRLNFRNEWGKEAVWSVDFGVEGDLNFTHARNDMQRAANLDTWRFSYGGNMMITTPFQLTLSSDIRNESRRGYKDVTMNTDELIWNASLSQNMKSWLKNHDLTLSLEWYDILCRRSNISRNITATYRSDSYMNAINSYFMVHLIYRLKLFGDREARNSMKNNAGFDFPSRPEGRRWGSPNERPNGRAPM